LVAVFRPVRVKPPVEGPRDKIPALVQAFFRRLPFMRGKGFTPPNQVEYNEINLDQLNEAFKADAEVTPETLDAARMLRDVRNPIVILGRGDLDVALKVRVHRVSANAKAKIEKAGGSVETIH